MSLVSAQGRYKVIGVLCIAVFVMAALVLSHVFRFASVVGRADTFNRVKTIMVRRLSVNEEKVTPQASLETDFKSEGLNRAEFVTALQEEFEMDIPDEDAEKFVRVQDAVNYIQVLYGDMS